MHVVAAKAVALGDAMTEGFREYQEQIIRNAVHFSACMEKKGYRIVSGGTDTHLFLVDLTPIGITGKEAQEALEDSGIMLNKNLIPFDERGPNVTSGVRIGTPAVTTRGMKEREMETMADLIDVVLRNRDDMAVRARVKEEVRTLCKAFPFYSKIYPI